MSSLWPPPPNYLDRKQPSSLGRLSFVACPPAVVPVGASLTVRPSGPHELLVTTPSLSRNVFSFTVANGVPGRVYTLNLLTTDALRNAYQVLAFLPVSDTLLADPPPEPLNQGFGPAITTGRGSLGNDGGVLVTTMASFPIATRSLVPGDVWSNGGVLNYVPGFVPDPTLPVIFFDDLTAPTLAAVGVKGLNTSRPPVGSLQLYLVGLEIWVA